MCVDPFLKDLKETKKENVILFGIEAHVCVLQTAQDLLENGFNVHLAADATSSQRPFDRSVAFDRMKEMGVYISTTESLLFQMLRTAEFEKFKDISKLCNVKHMGPRPNPGTY